MIKFKDKEFIEFRAKEYAKALNRIDDYFEYSYESAKDRQVVFSILGDLSVTMHRFMEERRDEDG